MTDELKKLYTYNPVDQVQHDTLSITHSLFSREYHLVKGNSTMTFAGVDYEPSGFTFTLPEKGGNQQDLSISIDNVESAIINELESALATEDESIQVIYRTFINTDPDTVQFQLTLDLQEVVVNKYSIEGRASNVNLFDALFPKLRFDSWVFTGLTI